MSRSYWNLYSKATGSWVADGTIARPNEDLELPRHSTQIDFKLADGSEAAITPSTKYLRESLTLTWYYDDGTVKDKIEGYINNQTSVKIVDHNSVEYVGRFTYCKPTWLVGTDGDYYDVEATFKIMPSLT